MPQFEPVATPRDWAVIKAARKYAAAEDAAIRNASHRQPLDSFWQNRLLAGDQLRAVARAAYSHEEGK